MLFQLLIRVIADMHSRLPSDSPDMPDALSAVPQLKEMLPDVMQGAENNELISYLNERTGRTLMDMLPLISLLPPLEVR